MNKPTFILLACVLSFLNMESQDYLEMMNSEEFTVQEIQNTAQAYFETKGTGRGTGYKSFKRWEYNAIRMQDENGFLKPSSFYFDELERYNSEINNSSRINRTSLVSNWEELGPAYWNQTSGWNPGVGRITSIAIDANNANHLKIAPSDSNTMYAAVGSSLFKTTSGGVSGNWSTLTGFAGAINSIAIHPTNPNKLAIATNSSNKIYVSTDGGATWNSMLYDLPSFAALALVWDTTYDEDILYLGMNYGAYYLRANETTWTTYNSDLPNVQINELEVNSADNKLYAATYGRGLLSVNLYDPTNLELDEFDPRI